MWKYYSRLAWLSIKKTPVLSALMILAIATGIAASLTTMTLYNVVSSNPLAHKNEQLFALQLDSWDADETFWEINSIPPMLTYRDAKSLFDAKVADQMLLMSRAGVTVESINGTLPPKVEGARMTTSSFFSLLDVPFVYGSGWSTAADQAGEQQVVLRESLSRYFFGEGNSVGETLMIERDSYTVVGIIADDWSMMPSVYDLNMDAFKQPEQLYIPFFNFERRAFPSWGNVIGWKNEDIRSHQDFLASEQVWVGAWVQLGSAAKKAEFEQLVRSYIEEQKNIGRFQRPLSYALSTPKQWLDIHQVVSRDNRILVLLSLAFLAVCLVNAVVLLLAKFLRKAPEAGLRRALGASRQAIFVQHLVESAAIGVAGGALGLVLSWFGLMGIRILYHHYESVAVMSIFTVIAALVLALVSSLLSGCLPAWQISRAQPSRYLKSQ